MSTESLRIAITGQEQTAAGDDVWVRLEQVRPSRLAYYASARDIYKMWTRAVTGQSAQTMRPPGCPVGFAGDDIYVWLGVYVWPSHPDLAYALSAAIGTVGTAQIIRKDKEFSLFVNNSNRIDLPYYMEDLSWEWESPCFDRYGAEISSPAITNHRSWLEFSTEVFGGLRLNGTACGYYHVSEMILHKPLTEEELSEEEQEILQTEEQEEYEDNGILVYVPKRPTRMNGYKIENLQNTITAAWTEADGSTDTDQLRLEIPPCVEEALAFCPDMNRIIVLLCKEVSTRQVYYSTCTGEIVTIWDGIDPMKYCVDISGMSVTAAPMGGFGII